MQKTLRLLGILSVAVAVGMTCAWAEHRSTPSIPRTGDGEVFDSGSIWRDVASRTVDLPRAVAPSLQPVDRGPVVFGNASPILAAPSAMTSASGGSSMLAPGGGIGFSTPREIAERQIRRLIRRLE